MFLSPAEISGCIHWLIDNASPPVRYLTYRDLLKADPHCEPMQDLWKQVETSRAAQEVFSRQNADGSWFSGGPWGPRSYRQETGRGYTMTHPKFVTTAWILPYLGEMGFSAADERVRKSCQLILHEAAYQSYQPGSGPGETNVCGLFAIPLRACTSVGMAVDERLQAGWDRLRLCQRDDGGWLNPNHLADSPTPAKTVGRWPWNRSCAWGSFFAVQALYYAHDPKYAHALSAGLDFMLWHLSQSDLQSIQTWVYHGHNTIKELLMFSEASMDMSAPAIQSLLTWLKGYYRPEEGMFRTQAVPIPDFVRHVSAVIKDFEERCGPAYWTTVAKTSPPVLRYHLYHLVEDDWLTYTLTRVALNLTPMAIK